MTTEQMSLDQAMQYATDNGALVYQKAAAAEVLAKEVERLREELAVSNDKLEKAFAHAANIGESAVILLGQRDELQRRIDEAEGQSPVFLARQRSDNGAYDEVLAHGKIEACRRDSGTWKALYLKPFPAPAHTALLAESDALFRRYEAHHRAKGGEADEKAEVNRVIAERIESVLNEVNHGQG